MNFKIHRISKSERQMNFGENYRINTRLNLKTRLIWDKKNYTIIREMSWCNVLWRAGSEVCENDNFLGTFVDFRLKIFTQKRISIYDDPCP